MKNKILSFLKESNNEFISGEDISNKLGISRAAIWKHINALKKEGYKIESISRKGYKLISSPDILTYVEIKEYLNTKEIGRNFLHFDTIGSTNTKAKEIAEKGAVNGTTIISEEQTSGKGRLGRQWTSPKYKGIWMSIILKPNIKPNYAPLITQIAAAAVFKALLSQGVKASIKWPNDIIVNNKKVCGILTEMNSELDKIHYIILGIGVNVNIESYEFPNELKNIATSLKAETNKLYNRKILVSEILNNFEYLFEDFVNTKNLKKSIDICKKNSFIIGKEVLINKKGEEIPVKIIDIDDEGKLIVEYKDGTRERVISGEVSMHGIYGRS